jgi:NADPH:quinone reductase-like Zn-dependent oxidoreductase
LWSHAKRTLSLADYSSGSIQHPQSEEDLPVKAARIHSFGPPDVVVVEDVPVPSPGPGEVLVRVMAAGVAPWDATIREGKSKVSPQPPLTLGSDLSGIVERIG